MAADFALGFALALAFGLALSSEPESSPIDRALLCLVACGVAFAFGAVFVFSAPL